MEKYEDLNSLSCSGYQEKNDSSVDHACPQEGATAKRTGVCVLVGVLKMKKEKKKGLQTMTLKVLFSSVVLDIKKVQAKLS